MEYFEQQPTPTTDLAEQRRRMSSILRGLQYKKIIGGCVSILAGVALFFLPLVSFLGIVDVSLWDLCKENITEKGSGETMLKMLLGWDGKEQVLGSIGILGSLFFGVIIIALGVTDVLRGIISIAKNDQQRIANYQGMGFLHANDPEVVRYLNGIFQERKATALRVLLGVALLLAFFFIPPVLYLRYMKHNLFVIQEAQVILCAVVWLVYVIKIYVGSWYNVQRKEDLAMLLGLFGKEGMKLI